MRRRRPPSRLRVRRLRRRLIDSDETDEPFEDREIEIGAGGDKEMPAEP